MATPKPGYTYSGTEWVPMFNGGVPTGTVVISASIVSPDGWLICNGSAVSRTTYAPLFAALGTTYGTGDGSTTFNLPDMRGRVVAGTNSADSDFNALGKTGGSKTSVAPHTHGIDHDHPAFTSGNDSPDHSHNAGSFHGENTAADWCFANGGGRCFKVNDYAWTSGANTRHQHNIDVPAYTGTSGAASAGATSGNLQPYISMNYIIKY